MKTLCFGALALTAAAAAPAAALPLDYATGPELGAYRIRQATVVCNDRGRCWRTDGRGRATGRGLTASTEYYVDYGEYFYVRPDGSRFY